MCFLEPTEFPEGPAMFCGSHFLMILHSHKVWAWKTASLLCEVDLPSGEMLHSDAIQQLRETGKGDSTLLLSKQMKMKPVVLIHLTYDIER